MLECGGKHTGFYFWSCLNREPEIGNQTLEPDLGNGSNCPSAQHILPTKSEQNLHILLLLPTRCEPGRESCLMRFFLRISSGYVY